MIIRDTPGPIVVPPLASPGQNPPTGAFFAPPLASPGQNPPTGAFLVRTIAEAGEAIEVVKFNDGGGYLDLGNTLATAGFGASTAGVFDENPYRNPEHGDFEDIWSEDNLAQLASDNWSQGERYCIDIRPLCVAIDDDDASRLSDLVDIVMAQMTVLLEDDHYLIANVHISAGHPVTGWDREDFLRDGPTGEKWLILIEAVQALAAAIEAGGALFNPVRVAFEPFNEPGDTSVEDVDVEGSFDFDAATWNTMQHALHAAVRSVMPRHTIILCGIQFSSVRGLVEIDPVDDFNVMYAWHDYDPVIMTIGAAIQFYSYAKDLVFPPHLNVADQTVFDFIDLVLIDAYPSTWPGIYEPREYQTFLAETAETATWWTDDFTPTEYITFMTDAGQWYALDTFFLEYATVAAKVDEAVAWAISNGLTPGHIFVTEVGANGKHNGAINNGAPDEDSRARLYVAKKDLYLSTGLAGAAWHELNPFPESQSGYGLYDPTTDPWTPNAILIAAIRDGDAEPFVIPAEPGPVSPQHVGALAGAVVGNPGTLPSSWDVTPETTSTHAVTTAPTLINNVEAITLNLGVGFFQIFIPDGYGGSPAMPGDTIDFEVYVQALSGTVTGIVMTIHELDADFDLLDEHSLSQSLPAFFSFSNTLLELHATLSDPDVAHVSAFISLEVTSAASVRISPEFVTDFSLALERLHDTFGAPLDPVKWTVFESSSADVTAGRMEIPLRNTYAEGFNSLRTDWDLTGSHLHFKLQIENADATQFIQAAVQEGATPGDDLLWEVNLADGFMKAAYRVGGDPGKVYVRDNVTWNAVTHLWLRIREAGGTIYWDYSGSGSSWTNYTSVAKPGGIDITAVKVVFFGGAFGGQTASAFIDNVNS